MNVDMLEREVAKEIGKGKYSLESKAGGTAVLVRIQRIQRHNRICLVLFPPLYIFMRLKGPGRLVMTVKNGRVRRKKRR